MKTRSKSGAFLPCEDLVRRWVAIFTGFFHVNSEQSGGHRQGRVRRLQVCKGTSCSTQRPAVAPPDPHKPVPNRSPYRRACLPSVPQCTLNFSKRRAEGFIILPSERSGGSLCGWLENWHLLSLGACADRDARTLRGAAVGEKRVADSRLWHFVFSLVGRLLKLFVASGRSNCLPGVQRRTC